jgi:8-oxo-dGTP pyrophosphatase MutT (NUDIX family)
MSTSVKFAVAVIVLRKRDYADWEVLLVARKDDHTRWGLPGGKMEQGEAPITAALRELEEETGILAYDEFLVPQETVLDSGGYLTTFYLLVSATATENEFPETFDVGNGEAPVRWGRIEELFDGPFGNENRERFRKMGITP